MCGRYVSPEAAAIEREYRIDRRSPHPLIRNADARPTNRIPIIFREPEGATVLAVARWGLVPTWWSKEKPPALTFNARSEQAASKPMWRDAWRHARCVIPAEGWYVWRDAVDAKTGEVLINPKTRKPLRKKYYVGPSVDGLIAFAGLYSPRAERDDCDVSATIVTGAARGPIAWLHDRMPCVLRPAAVDAWLDPGSTDPAAASALLADCREDFRADPG